jgi:hypothetical protein
VNATLPTHPDYARILQVFADGDDSIDETQPDPTSHEESLVAMERVFGHLVNPESLARASISRARVWLMALVPAILSGKDPSKSLGAMWADGFIAGVRFQQAGGHSSPDTTD